MPRVAVCLSGCGVFDGTEIHEAVLTLLSLDQAGADIQCCAPDKEQSVVNHLSKEDAGEKRNVLVESARIARGSIKPLSEIKADTIDALIFPGGFGAAKNLSTFAEDGPQCRIDPQVESLVGQMLEAKKPIGAICISPAMLARIVGQRNLHPKLTIGTDTATAQAINTMGAEHTECQATECIVDEEHRIVSTPAYMLGSGPAEVYEGIKKLVDEVIKMIQPE